MKFKAREFLKNTGLDDVNEEALYLLIPGPQGITLESLSPLLAGLERAYRALLSVSVDPFLRERIETFKARRSRGPLTRSINARYNRYVSKEPEPPASAEADADSDAIMGTESENLLELIFPDSLIDEPESIDFIPLSGDGIREFFARRVEITRAKISSPGFIEISGDPTTLASILALLLGLLKLRRLESLDGQDAIGQRWQNARDNARVLREIGFSPEQIAGLYEYLEQDLGTILRELEQIRIVLALGEELEERGFITYP
jgi:hypothetical protein